MAESSPTDKSELERHYAAMIELHGRTQFATEKTSCIKCGTPTEPYKAAIKNGNPFCFPCERDLASHVIDCD